MYVEVHACVLMHVVCMVCVHACMHAYVECMCVCDGVGSATKYTKLGGQHCGVSFLLSLLHGLRGLNTSC